MSRGSALLLLKRFCSTSVFKKKPSLRSNLLKYENPADTMNKIFAKTSFKTTVDWKLIREDLLSENKNISMKNVDSVLINYCILLKEYDVALSYIDYINKQNLKPSLLLTGYCFKLYYFKKCADYSIKQATEMIILNLYSDLRKLYPVLDCLSLENAILGLSTTTKWQECLDLMSEIKTLNTPSTNAYSAIISAAILNGHNNIAWNLICELFDQEREPNTIVYLSYFHKLREVISDKEFCLEKLEELFMVCHQYEILFQEDLAINLSKLASQLEIDAHFTAINRGGYCKHCKNKIDKFEISDAEFRNLKNKVVENVIIGRNVFNKSTPSELERLKQFSLEMNQFDVVIDGLNVSYSVGTKQPKNVLCSLLSTVVSHFAQKNEKVLIIGRTHMSKWPAKCWKYISDNATLFLTEDDSQDDPYLLYCALHSGKNTKIITRDLMRSHQFLLKDRQERVCFRKWLSQRQYQLLHIANNGSLHFKVPLPYTKIAQKNKGYWHIPCKAEDKNEEVNKWLCLKF